MADYDEILRDTMERYREELERSIFRYPLVATKFPLVKLTRRQRFRHWRGAVRDRVIDAHKALRGTAHDDCL